MNDNLSDNEKFIIMILFSLLFFIYLAFGIFDSPIHPLIKLLPFYALTIYVIIRNQLKKHKKNEGN